MRRSQSRSARSASGFNLHEGLAECTEHLLAHGGHAAAAGLKIDEVDVNHRERKAGQSKYTNLDRAIRGVDDLVGVCWMLKRKVILPELEKGGEGTGAPDA